MPTIRYGAELNILVVARGHPYSRDDFMAIFDEMPGVCASLVEQPAAQGLMNAKGMAAFDALVLYDMPGLDFAAADRPGFVEPSEAFKAGFLDLLESGKGIVALHHAIAGWPAWPLYAELMGGRFLYRSGELRGTIRQDSGYRHDVAHNVLAADPDHPVLAGLPPRFPLVDELYLFEVFEDLVTPLLRSDAIFDQAHFYSAAQAVAGKMFSNVGWDHPPGSDLIGWTKRAGRSPLVYLQPGDGPATYRDPNYRRLVENAVRWAASPEALAWARDGVTSSSE